LQIDGAAGGENSEMEEEYAGDGTQSKLM